MRGAPQRPVGSTGAEDRCNSSERRPGHSGGEHQFNGASARVIGKVATKSCPGDGTNAAGTVDGSVTDTRDVVCRPRDRHSRPSRRVHEIICPPSRGGTSSGGPRRRTRRVSDGRTCPNGRRLPAGCGQLTSCQPPDPSTEWPPRREIPRIRATTPQNPLCTRRRDRDGGRQVHGRATGWVGRQQHRGRTGERQTDTDARRQGILNVPKVRQPRTRGL